MTPDKLVKALSQYLFRGDFRPEQLRAAGWSTFVRFDRPDTQDPIVMGARALVYLFGGASFTDRGHALRRVIAFVSAHLGCDYPDPGAIKAGIELMKPDELDENAISEWLRASCT